MANNLINKTQEQLIKYTQKYYKIAHKCECNFENPIFFTEKIQWYTFNYHNPLCPYIVDKVTFKDYIKQKLGDGCTIPLIGSWKTVEEFERDWFTDKLPKEFCLKSNLQSDGRCIKIVHDKDSICFADLKEEVREWLKPENTCINSLARNFYESTPQILAENFMSNYKDQLYDYKFFCFNGEPYCMYVATEHFDEGGNKNFYPILFYDLNWKKMDVKYGNHPNDADVPEPEHYKEMITYAKILSKDFPFVRVDFFDTAEKLYLAELTFNPGGGFTPYYPIEFNKQLGDLFVLPKL